MSLSAFFYYNNFFISAGHIIFFTGVFFEKPVVVIYPVYYLLTLDNAVIKTVYVVLTFLYLLFDVKLPVESFIAVTVKSIDYGQYYDERG